jgi:hypothetical protein
MKRKGVYPYEYMDSFEKFSEISLPPIKEFNSKLTNKGISIEDYEYAQTVWKAMNIKNMGEWHDLYLKTDVLILTDVFENFRKICYHYYQLDPACYLSAPGLAWDAVLKMTAIKLENITDTDMYIRIESSLRGGMCSVGAERLAEANNKYIEGYTKSALQTYIEYFDANNLYGDAMVRSLPTGNYKWENPKNFNSKFITNYNFEKESKGYYFTVDLEYPKSLHDLHNDYPLAPERMEAELSPYMKVQSEELNHKVIKGQKLIANLKDKNDYTVHGAILQLYLDLGLKIKEIKYVISFDQSKWLKKYIDFNSEKRAIAKQNKNDFEVNFFKLMNNSVYGKFIENLKNRSTFDIFTSNDKIQKKIN